MNDMIKINNRKIGEGEIPTANARELYAFLEVKTAFKDWISRRIEDFGFVENRDFCSFLSESGGRPSREYHLTLDMAKELSMVERNEKGKQARQYFIECERRAKQDPIVALQDPHTMRILLLSYSEKVIALESTIKEQLPKALGFDRISNAEGSLCITDTAKTMQIQPKVLFHYLSENKWIYRRAGGKHWIAYQDKIQQGLLIHKTTTVSTSDGTEKTVEQVLVTPKGLTKLSLIFSGQTRQVAA